MPAGHQQPPSKGYILFTSLGGRLYAMIGIAFFAFFAVSFYQTFHLKQALEVRTLPGPEAPRRGCNWNIAGGIRRQRSRTDRRRGGEERAALRLSKLRYDQEGYFWINDLEPKMIMHPMKPELDGKNLSNIKDPDGVPLFVEFVRLVKERGSGFVNYSWPKPGAQAPQPKLSYVTGFAPWGWVVGTGLYTDDLHQQAWSKLKGGLWIVTLVLLAIAGGALMFARSLSKTLTALTAVIAGVAKGNLEIPPAGTDDRTELGAIARAVEALRLNAIEQMALQAEVGEARERERKRELHLEACTQEFEKSITAAVAALGEQVDMLWFSAETLSEAAQTSTMEADSAAGICAGAADNSQAVSAATEQLSCSIREIAGQAHRTNSVVETASEEADQTNKDVAGLASAAEEIGSIVAVIRGIADQTNLLALNAPSKPRAQASLARALRSWPPR